MSHDNQPHVISGCPDCQKSHRRPYTIEDVVKKWSPLVHSKKPPFSPLEARVAEFTAWAMEEEARFLNEPGRNNEHIGIALKYVFPLLRRVAPSYANGEMPEFEALIGHFKNEAALVNEALLVDGKETVTPEEINKMIPPMVERFQGAIKTFKEAVA